MEINSGDDGSKQGPNFMTLDKKNQFKCKWSPKRMTDHQNDLTKRWNISRQNK